MLYSEIFEAAQSRRASKEAENRTKARDQLAAAERKRSQAARKYQDDVRSARSAAQQAKARIQSLSIPEGVYWPDGNEAANALSLLERSKGYALRDRSGTILGWIEPVGRLVQGKDRNGSVVGWYDPRQNQTRDNTGSLVGTGDFLSALIMASR